MTTLTLNVHGVGVSLEGPAAPLELLGVFFHPWKSAAASSGAIHVRLHQRAPDLTALGRSAADQVVERGVVYNRGPTTWVDHHGHALSRFDFSRQEGEVWAPEDADLVELAYLMVHARLGPALEARGLVRVHGLGWERANRAHLLLMPSGGGKSRLALALLEQPQVRLLSDDVVLLDRSGAAHPFPMPLGVSNPSYGERWGRVIAFHRRHHPRKFVIALDAMMHRFTEGPVPLASIVLGRRVTAEPSLYTPLGRRAVAGAMVRDAVVGVGLPQVIELMVRRGSRDLWRQAPTALRRSRVVLAALRRAHGGRLDIAAPESAAAALAAL